MHISYLHIFSNSLHVWKLELHIVDFYIVSMHIYAHWRFNYILRLTLELFGNVRCSKTGQLKSLDSQPIVGNVGALPLLFPLQCHLV